MVGIIRKTRRVVVKIGASVLADASGRLSHKALMGVAKGIASIQKKGVHVILVSSGAVASGMQYLGFDKKPQKISELQACAAIGQPILIKFYQQAFSRSRLQAAQILLTRNDLEDRARFLNARHTLLELLRHNVIPIINENDTVVVDEMRVGDNDNLSALVTGVINADLLILLTDQDGFHTSDPRQDPEATRIPLVETVDGKLLAKASDTRKAISVGGMKTKLQAAQKACHFGAPTLIANGRHPRILERIFTAESVGTLFALGKKKRGR